MLHIHIHNTHTYIYIYIYICVCVCVCLVLESCLPLRHPRITVDNKIRALHQSKHKRFFHIKMATISGNHGVHHHDI